MTTTRRTLLAAAAPALALASVHHEASADSELSSLVDRARQAHTALMQGDLDRYFQQIRISDDFTLMAPFGGPPTHGVSLSAERWASIGRFFKGGRDSTLELIQAYRSTELVVLVAIERTVAEVGGLAEQRWDLRVTLVFRRESGQWQLAHRHADPLVNAISLERAATLAAGRT
jgi:ketosteroid isomerase-like protein